MGKNVTFFPLWQLVWVWEKQCETGEIFSVIGFYFYGEIDFFAGVEKTCHWRRQFAPLAVACSYSVLLSVCSICSFFPSLSQHRLLSSFFFLGFSHKIPLLNIQVQGPPETSVSSLFFLSIFFNHHPFPVIVCWLYLSWSSLMSTYNFQFLVSISQQSCYISSICLGGLCEIIFFCGLFSHTADRCSITQHNQHAGLHPETMTWCFHLFRSTTLGNALNTF